MASSITVRPLPPVREQQQQQQGDKTKESNDKEDDQSATKPHHRPGGGGFQNPWNSFKQHSLSEALRLRFGSHPEKNFVPVPQGPDGPKRYTPTPCALAELPEVDVVCISHNHYDHLDYATVQHIYDRQGGKVHFVAGLGNKKWFTQHVGCQEDEHGSGRSINDQGQTLWCSWAIESNGKKLYFAGDTAYKAEDAPAACPAFEEIGESLGPFDLALLPIGLMSPHQWMGSVHATPEQSLQIHKDVKSRLSIGMHWGTVRGGISAHFEDVRDPPRRWQAAAEKEGLWRGGEPQGKPLQTEDTGSGPSEYGGVGLCEVGETVTV
ncbi:hypothetical protein D0859_13441 [Hortaea werneckii]|uniref:Metallo-beta-lactamase domain-containing protein n=1 Tax=Hortaea werneckii TaxID=91943 RepID=A0A3M7IAE8_HORWE|nr:hypothetical protein D0859_13441 [Hortaea werneckii]